MLGGTPSVFTIHNLAYQGLFARTGCRVSICRGSCCRSTAWNSGARISFLKGGINYADAITTVSPRYAEEIQTPELGFGFDGILRRAPPISSAS